MTYFYLDVSQISMSSMVPFFEEAMVPSNFTCTQNSSTVSGTDLCAIQDLTQAFFYADQGYLVVGNQAPHG